MQTQRLLLPEEPSRDLGKDGSIFPNSSSNNLAVSVWTVFLFSSFIRMPVCDGPFDVLGCSYPGMH